MTTVVSHDFASVSDFRWHLYFILHFPSQCLSRRPHNFGGTTLPAEQLLDFAGSDPANPASSRPGSEQGRQVPDVGDAQRQLGGEGAGPEEAGKVPAEEGAVPRRGCGERGDVARRVPSEYRDVDQLLGLVAEEELEQCEDPPHQEHDGEVLPHPRLSGMSG